MFLRVLRREVSVFSSVWLTRNLWKSTFCSLRYNLYFYGHDTYLYLSYSGSACLIARFWLNPSDPLGILWITYILLKYKITAFDREFLNQQFQQNNSLFTIPSQLRCYIIFHHHKPLRKHY